MRQSLNVKSLPDREAALDVRNLPGLAMKLVENAAEGILITKKNGTIVYANNAFLQISGYSFDETLGKTPRMLQSGKHGREFYREMWDNLSFHGAWQGEVWNQRKDGSIYPQQRHGWAIPMMAAGTTPRWFTTTKVKHNEEADEPAYHDARKYNRHLLWIG
jgi:PAS domain S-box-containing protein